MQHRHEWSIAGCARRWGVAAGVCITLAAGPVQQARAQADPFLAPVIPAVPMVPSQFDITGFIQEATLDTTGAICQPASPRLAGGTVTVNGHRIIIPCNTILQMPAFTLTWADLFQRDNPLVPADIAPAGQTGLALNDRIAPVPGATVPATQPGLLTAATPQTPYNGALPSYEIHVVGNIVSQRYIAGLVFLSQQQLNAGQGVISCIDYATGELQVGGTPTDPTVAPFGCPMPPPPGVTRVRINDAIGRYGKAHAAIGGCGGRADCVEEAGFDPRFTPDTDNPTIHASTGFPMCIPRVNPFDAGHVDPECPQSNRPIAPNCRSFPAETGITPFPAPSTGYCMTYMMDAPGTPAPSGVTCPGPDPRCPTDPNKQVPFEIGDNITFNGTLKTDGAGVYVSAHTIGANLGIYTFPNTPPAYTFVETLLAGTDQRPVAGLAQEATGRVLFVGFTTDVFNLVDLFALDQDPLSGAVSERLLGTQTAFSSPLLGRFRTPVNNNGAFLPPTRNYRAVSRTMCAATSGPSVPCMPANRDATSRANGLVAGQYLLPNFEFIFAENLVFGDPLVPNNFQDLPFLFCGSGPVDGPGSGTPVVGQLDPAPWAAPMDDPIFHSTLCPGAPAVSAGRVFPPVVGAPDVLNIVAAAWDNRANKGKVNLVVTSSATPAPRGMFMQATLVNDTLPAGTPGSTANPITSEMVLTGNSPAAAGVCPTNDPCWQLIAPGFIVNPAGNGSGVATLVPPTTISVRSSLGGTATTAAIAIKPCLPSRRLVCP
ncbi:hypothetical protein [Ramlibacter alkalitolerans]|uniref:Uncharacterized protein n=1 Tax=Ramlibacter alkalitolerans TaxID=2039631 RepID=A0ABS1JN52_9BURK|nr:hypothetical protein [Ramlibacter alkalitolerans]MBL0425326.1 hypothetical protein [Ramlibacter alkalitolerans]